MTWNCITYALFSYRFHDPFINVCKKPYCKMHYPQIFNLPKHKLIQLVEVGNNTLLVRLVANKQRNI